MLLMSSGPGSITTIYTDDFGFWVCLLFVLALLFPLQFLFATSPPSPSSTTSSSYNFSSSSPLLLLLRTLLVHSTTDHGHYTVVAVVAAVAVVLSCCATDLWRSFPSCGTSSRSPLTLRWRIGRCLRGGGGGVVDVALRGVGDGEGGA
jgi:hypothetical protein